MSPTPQRPYRGKPSDDWCTHPSDPRPDCFCPDRGRPDCGKHLAAPPRSPFPWLAIAALAFLVVGVALAILAATLIE